MRLFGRVSRRSLAGIILALSITGVVFTTLPAKVSAAPSGTYFDHIVVVAMENTAYSSVFGSGTVASCPTGSAPFLCSMLPVSSTIPSMNNYGATSADSNDFNGCSAACYAGFMFGYTYGVSDGYSFSSISGNPQFVNSLTANGLTWQAYCESGCPRGADHFPFSGSKAFRSSSVSTSDFVAAANSASPPNFLWYTPTDSNNMHDVSVSTGDSYLQSFLVGSGSISSPASGSLLASNVFTNPNYRTVLYLWWDECGGNNGSCDSNNDAPNLFYGTTVKKGYVSPDSTGIDEYASIWTIENNWGFSPLAQGDTAAQSSGYTLNDIFTSAASGGGGSGGSGSPGMSASFTFTPAPLTVNNTVTFSATVHGGTGPYIYSWDFGDGSTATGASPAHMYDVPGTYNITMTATDNNGLTYTYWKQVTVGQTSPGLFSNGLFTILSLLVVGLVVGGGGGAALYLKRYHAENLRLQNRIDNGSTTRSGQYGARVSRSTRKGRSAQKKRVVRMQY
ncbi:MAG TPA: PKD domain-containing protein [Candidatus Dormibacteraeota bacterium]|nr:PKD domain-containing protein [Candidatus Dormibacteraeota bacterium]